MKPTALVRALAPGRLARPGARAALAAALLAVVAVLCVPAAAARAGDDQPTQWQIDARAEALQTAPPPAEKPVICIVDTGVTPTPDLDIVSRTALDGGTPDDVTARPGHYGHGTTVAHMAAGKVNGWGSSGVFPHARIASVRIFDDVNQRVPWQMYVRALEWCGNVRPRPVTTLLSLGGREGDNEELDRLRSQISRSREREGISVVAAAGNGGGPSDMPAAVPETFNVTGATPDGGLCSFSARDQSVDLAAPGCSLTQAGWNGSPYHLDGTSFAAPIAAGVLAAVRSYVPGLSAASAETLLMRSGPPGTPARLDAAAAFGAGGLDTSSWRERLPEPIARDVETRTAPDESERAATGEARLIPHCCAHLRAPAGARSRSGSECRPLPRPRIGARLAQKQRPLTVKNWRRGLTVEVRAAGRVLRFNTATVRLPRRSRMASLRLLTDLCVSPWVRVSVRR